MRLGTTKDGEPVLCYGNAEPDDLHLLATVHCRDGEILEWLERRDRKESTAWLRQRSGRPKNATR
jgi:hypothetical protein